MTRIIAGLAGGRRLVVPPRGTRPTAERVREAIFSSLSAEQRWDGLRVLDLFAGSGALGLEAVSRGCIAAVLVDCDPRAARVCARNVSSLGVAAAVAVSAMSAQRWLNSGHDGEGFDLIFLDPPYEQADDVVDDVLKRLTRSGLLRERARIVVERSKHAATPHWPVGCSDTRSRRFGDTIVHRAIWYGP